MPNIHTLLYSVFVIKMRVCMTIRAGGPRLLRARRERVFIPGRCRVDRRWHWTVAMRVGIIVIEYCHTIYYILRQSIFINYQQLKGHSLWRMNRSTTSWQNRGERPYVYKIVFQFKCIHGVLTPPKLPFPIDMLRGHYYSVPTSVRHCDYCIFVGSSLS